MKMGSDKLNKSSSEILIFFNQFLASFLTPNFDHFFTINFVRINCVAN
jgi:hypothetical protein